MDIQSAVVVAGVPAGAGALIDLWLKKKTRRQIHTRLNKTLGTLRRTNIPDLPNVIARHALQTLSLLLNGALTNRRAFTRIALVSCLLTTFAWILGRAIDESMGGTRFISSFGPLLYVVSFILALPINFLFDYGTVALTTHILRLVTRSTNALAPFLVLMDAILAYALAVTGATVALFLLSVASGGSADPFYWMTVASADLSLMSDSYDGQSLTWTGRLFALTTFIPTAAFAVALLVLMSLILALRASRIVTLRFIERAIDDDPDETVVFTLVGSIFGLAGLALEAVAHFAS